MGSTVTITPDPQPEQGNVTITPDPPQPSKVEQFMQGDPDSLPARFLHGVGLPGSFSEVGPWAKSLLAPRKKSALESGDHELPIVGPALAAQDRAMERGRQPGASFTEKAMGYLPVLGPMAERFGDNLASGDYAGAAGNVIGAVPMARQAAPEANVPTAGTASGAEAARAAFDAQRAGVNPLAAKLYQSALKPPPGSYSLPEVQSMVQTGLDAGIPVSKAGVEKLGGLISDLNDKIRAQIAANADAPISRDAVVSRLEQTKKTFTNQVNPESDLQDIRASGEEFTRNQPEQIRAADAQALKVGTYKQLSDRAYGDLSSATVEAQKALARGIKEELENQFPEIKGLNARQSKFYGLDEALERAVRRIDNREIFGLGAKLTGTAAFGVGEALTGNSLEAAATGTAAAMLAKTLSNPMVQSKLAIALSSASKGSITLANARMQVLSYVKSLGQAAIPAAGQASVGTEASDPSAQRAK